LLFTFSHSQQHHCATSCLNANRIVHCKAPTCQTGRRKSGQIIHLDVGVQHTRGVGSRACISTFEPGGVGSSAAGCAGERLLHRNRELLRLPRLSCLSLRRRRYRLSGTHPNIYARTLTTQSISKIKHCSWRDRVYTSIHIVCGRDSLPARRRTQKGARARARTHLGLGHAVGLGPHGRGRDRQVWRWRHWMVHP
jgi:hypothetical protein